MTNTLPVYKGYTVDYRLQEFRKYQYGALAITIKFNSSQGGLMLARYEAQLELDKMHEFLTKY